MSDADARETGRPPLSGRRLGLIIPERNDLPEKGARDEDLDQAARTALGLGIGLVDFPVDTATPYTFKLVGQSELVGGAVMSVDANLIAQYVPFGSTGTDFL